MKKRILIIGICWVVVGVGWFILQASAWAADSCSTFDYQPRPLYDTSSQVTLTMGPAIPGNQYKIEADCRGLTPPSVFSPPLTPVDGSISHTFQNSGGSACIFTRGAHNVSLWKIGEGAPVCTNTYEVRSQCSLDYSPKNPNTEDSLTVSGTSVPREATHVSISGPVTKSIGISVRDDNTFDASIGRLPSTGSYTITVIRVSGTDVFDVGCPSLPFYVHQAGVTPSPGFPGYYDPCADDTTGKCEACLGELIDPDKGIRENSATKAWTALGCVPTDPQEFVAWFLSSAIKLSGGIAFLLMLWGGFQMMTSTGDPEKLNQGKSIITSAAIGLLFIIFSVLLLKIIGIDIFQLPEWGQPFG